MLSSNEMQRKEMKSARIKRINDDDDELLFKQSENNVVNFADT